MRLRARHLRLAVQTLVLILFVGLFWCLLHPSYPGPWWWWILWHPIVVVLGYGPCNGVGEELHGELWKGKGDDT